MDRQIIYPGQIPLDTDLLNTNKNAMLAIGRLAAAALGVNGVVQGLAVSPTSPASLNVSVAPGSIYSLQNVDNTAYGSLAADANDQIVKQGIILSTTQLSCPAPGTSGQSINYLVQAAFNEADTGLVALPYYNSSNPSQAWSGPGNSGTPQATTRSNQCVVSVVAGTANTTGSQTTPAPSAGAIGLAVVTVANGQATITAANIAQYTGAALVPSDGLASSIAHSMYTKNVAGAANVTLTAQEAAYPILTLTGTLTGNINVYVNQPATTPAVRQRIINNQTTGNFTVTVTTQAGTGTIAPQGLAIPMFCDGTNVNSSVSALLTQAQGDARHGSAMFPFAPTVATNALGGSLGACKLDFRNPTLATGTPVSASIASTLALPAVPTTSSLGAVTAQLTYFVYGVAYNGGTPVACIANMAGGLVLDGSAFVSPTTIGAASNASNVVYSASAVGANSPFTPIGILGATWTSGTGWAITSAQPLGGAVRTIPLASIVQLNTANGYGSTNTMIRRFTNVVMNQGPDITYADSATLGATFTINNSGVYAISYCDQFTASNNNGISLNSNQLTTAIQSINASNILNATTTVGANLAGAVSWTGPLSAGSVVRAHTNGTAAGTSVNAVQFTISRVN